MKFRSCFHFILISKEDFIIVFQTYFITLENILKNVHFRFMQCVTNSTEKVFLESDKKQKKYFKKMENFTGSCTQLGEGGDLH